MTSILGISAFYHDSAAALVIDGRLVAAAQEERFTRIKHDASFPTRAVAYCLAEAGLDVSALDYVAYYEKPLAKFERLLETYLAFAPRGFASFRMAMPLWIKEKLYLRKTIREGLGQGSAGARLVFLDHHESHAASAFFPCPFDEAAILTLDGVGEWSTTTVGTGRGNRIVLDEQIQFPHSLGLLYSAFTYFCGFKVNSGEYKLMGLAPYGTPRYQDLILEKLIALRPDGSFRLNMEYFNYGAGLTMTGPRFHALFGREPRSPESRIERLDMDLAASIQAVTETVVLSMARHVYERTGMKRLVLAGGVALNCVANGRLLREGPFDDLWIQPAAGDAGGALGAAQFVWHQLLEKPRHPGGRDAQHGSRLGPGYDDGSILQALARRGISGRLMASDRQLAEEVARLLAEGRIVGWFQGRMEFGPRALGSRSILGDPRDPAMQARMNLKIKFRESFRPFAPIVLRERASEWFELAPEHESPYMLLVARVRAEHLLELSAEERERIASDPDLLQRVNIPRSTIPAVTHVDMSARIQTVDAERDARLHELLVAFDRLTGCPVLVNTSFNVRGEPIVCTPDDAIRCFLATDMDVLVLGSHVVHKTAELEGLSEAERSEHLARFSLD